MILAALPQYVYLIIAIALIAFFFIVFFVSFVLYNKTPKPKGCEDVLLSESKCSMCNNAECKRNFKNEENTNA